MQKQSRGRTGRRPLLESTDRFVERHVGPRDADIREMLDLLGLGSLDELSSTALPKSIQLSRPLALGEPRGEHEIVERLRRMARKNEVYRSFIGLGYHDCITPPVILRGTRSTSTGKPTSGRFPPC